MSAPEQLDGLIAAVALRDQKAFRHLYDAVSAKLLGVALRILHDQARAEEVLQDCFVSVWNSAASYNPALSSPMTWLVAITRNRALDYLRRSPVPLIPIDEHLEPTLISDGPGPDFQAQRSQEALALERCLRRLDQGPRQAIATAYFHGLTHSELAIQLAVPVGTVKTWIRRGLDRLRQCLEAGGLAR